MKNEVKSDSERYRKGEVWCNNDLTVDEAFRTFEQ